MASNFWDSTHCNNWLISRTALAQAKQTDLKYATARQLATMSIFFSNLIYRLGKKLMFRQIPIATANVYFKRFYAKNAICETDPFMVAACCVYVAAKVDETPIHIKSVVSEARATFSEFNYRGFPVDYTKLAEMEFYLLEDLEFDLIVYHPYRTLAAVCGREAVDAGEFPDHDDDDDDGGNARERGIRKAMVDGASSDAGDAAEKESDEMDRLFGRGSGKPGSDVEDSILQMAWFILNDTYRTDLSILYPPYLIALAALYLSFSLEDKSPRDPFRVRGQTVSSLDRTSLITSSNNISELSTTDVAGHRHRNAMDRLITRARAAGYFADFAISLPAMLTIVQEIISLYPLWEELEGRNTFSSVPTTAVPIADTHHHHHQRESGAAAASNVPLQSKPVDSLREIEIVPMIQKMQRARAADLSHHPPTSSSLGDAEADPTKPDASDINPPRARIGHPMMLGKVGGAVVAGVKRRQPD